MRSLLAIISLAAATLLTAASVRGQEADSPIRPLSLFAPPDEAVFTNFPRTVHFRWKPVPQAASYAIEIDCMDCCVQGQWCSEAQGVGFIVADLKQPEYQFDFWGNQKGRWRVWAIDSQSQPGFKSAWSRFSFITPGQPAAQRVPPPSVGSAEPVYSSGVGVKAPRAIFSPNPAYTESARKARISGDVTMEIVVGSDGAVKEARIVRSLEPSLDDKALEAVRTWKFEPAIKDGHPVATRLQVSTEFRLL